MDELLARIDDMDLETLLKQAILYDFCGLHEKAFVCFEKAAELGDYSAMYHLANYYKNGWGTERSHERAAGLYMVVAEYREPLRDLKPGDPLAPQCDAEYNLGVLYEEGLLFDSSMEKAKEWYSRAATDGSPQAFIKMAQFYYDGTVVETDYNLSAKHLCYGCKIMRRITDKAVCDLAEKLLEKNTDYHKFLLQIIENYHAWKS